jgi:hypothetical protein
VDAALHDALALAVRLAEKEYDQFRTQAAALLVYEMRRALGAVEVYEEREASR